MDSRWRAEAGTFTLWALTSVAGLVSIGGILSIGVFVMPFAGVLLGVSILLTGRRPHREFTLSGLLIGPALALPFLGWALATPETINGHPAVHWGTFLPFSAAGAACLVLGVSLFLVLGRRAHRAVASATQAAPPLR